MDSPSLRHTPVDSQIAGFQSYPVDTCTLRDLPKQSNACSTHTVMDNKGSSTEEVPTTASNAPTDYQSNRDRTYKSDDVFRLYSERQLRKIQDTDPYISDQYTHAYQNTDHQSYIQGLHIP